MLLEDGFSYCTPAMEHFLPKETCSLARHPTAICLRGNGPAQVQICKLGILDLELKASDRNTPYSIWRCFRDIPEPTPLTANNLEILESL
jgi:hypothetical protein